MSSNPDSLQASEVIFSSPKSGDDVKPGDVLLRSSPYVSVLCREHRDHRCHGCFRPLSPSHWRCSICRGVAYCSQACRDHQANLHRWECSFLASAPRSSDTARLMMKLMVRMKEAREEDGEAVPGVAGRRKIQDLLSHSEEVVEDEERFDKIGKTYQELQRLEVGGLPPFNVFVELFSKVFINGFSVSDTFNKHVATALYLGPSILDHSCNPNALWTFEGNAIVIRAIEDIPDFSISKVQISYMDLLNERDYRVDHLLKNYYFICGCSRCVNPESEMSFHSIWCPGCHGRTCLKIGVKTKCHLCGSPFSDEVVGKYRDTIEKLKACLKGLVLSVSVVLECVDEMIEECLLHPRNVYYVKAVKMAFEECCNSKRFEEALRYGTLTVNSYRKYKDLNASAFVQILIKLARVEIKMDASKDIPEAYLEEAKLITAMICGKESELYQTIEELLSIV